MSKKLDDITLSTNMLVVFQNTTTSEIDSDVECLFMSRPCAGPLAVGYPQLSQGGVDTSNQQ